MDRALAEVVANRVARLGLLRDIRGATNEDIESDLRLIASGSLLASDNGLLCVRVPCGHAIHKDVTLEVLGSEGPGY